MHITGVLQKVTYLKQKLTWGIPKKNVTLDKVFKYCVLNLTLILIHSNIKSKIVFLIKYRKKREGGINMTVKRLF